MERQDYNRNITVRLFQASNALQTYLDQLLKEHQITAKQFFMMIIIGTFDEDPKLGDIAIRFETSHQNVKQVLLKLEKRGFVDLYKDDKDSRITRTRLTQQARAFWQARDDKDMESMANLYAPLSNEDMEITLQTLLTILSQLEQRTNPSTKGDQQ